MYDVDGNGVIDQEEMTKIVQAIYDMLGAGATRPTDSAEERAKNIFSRMDEASNTLIITIVTIMGEIRYRDFRADGVDGPQEMERN